MTVEKAGEIVYNINIPKKVRHREMLREATTRTPHTDATRPTTVTAAFSARACFECAPAHEVKISVDTVLAVSIFVILAVLVCLCSLSLRVLLPMLVIVAVRITVVNLQISGKTEYGKVEQDATIRWVRKNTAEA